MKIYERIFEKGSLKIEIRKGKESWKGKLEKGNLEKETQKRKLEKGNLKKIRQIKNQSDN